ncbi:hypothetical protein CR970_01690 [Candidatus Saccharibacteria bacterium]|nr:MAG: hypothetical protein CR970_01690 [Candidatus Saccharibacteria bacterium]
MGLFAQKSSDVDVRLYRYGERVYGRPWYARRVGLFGWLVFLLSVGMLLGVTYQQRTIALEDQGLYASVFGHALTFGDDVVLAEPESSGVALADNIIDLQPVLDAWQKQHPDQEWSVAVRSLNGPSFDAAIKERQTFGTSKIGDILMLRPLEQAVPYDDWKWRTRVRVGYYNVRIGDCLNRMFQKSDAACRQALLDKATPQVALSAAANLGLSQTAAGADGAPYTSSTKDVAALLYALETDLLTESARTQVLQSMSHREPRVGIADGCPGCTVQGISDDTEGLLDAGIVSYSRGRYILVIAAPQNAQWRDVAALSGQIQQYVIDRLP